MVFSRCQGHPIQRQTETDRQRHTETDRTDRETVRQTHGHRKRQTPTHRQSDRKLAEREKQNKDSGAANRFKSQHIPRFPSPRAGSGLHDEARGLGGLFF